MVKHLPLQFGFSLTLEYVKAIEHRNASVNKKRKTLCKKYLILYRKTQERTFLNAPYRSHCGSCMFSAGFLVKFKSAGFGSRFSGLSLFRCPASSPLLLLFFRLLRFLFLFTHGSRAKSLQALLCRPRLY